VAGRASRDAGLPSPAPAAGRRIIENAGAKLVYIPAYANLLNPIEEAFSKIKANLRRNRTLAIDHPRAAISAAFDTITHAGAAGYFRHSGYTVEEIIPGLLYN
jgi:transposase